jgi:hypothetical protein
MSYGITILNHALNPLIAVLGATVTDVVYVRAAVATRHWLRAANWGCGVCSPPLR